MPRERVVREAGSAPPRRDAAWSRTAVGAPRADTTCSSRGRVRGQERTATARRRRSSPERTRRYRTTMGSTRRCRSVSPRFRTRRFDRRPKISPSGPGTPRPTVRRRRGGGHALRRTESPAPPRRRAERSCPTGVPLPRRDGHGGGGDTGDVGRGSTGAHRGARRVPPSGSRFEAPSPGSSVG